MCMYYVLFYYYVLCRKVQLVAMETNQLLIMRADRSSLQNKERSVNRSQQVTELEEEKTDEADKAALDSPGHG